MASYKRRKDARELVEAKFAASGLKNGFRPYITEGLIPALI
jgi:hypothetical protein